MKNRLSVTILMLLLSLHAEAIQLIDTVKQPQSAGKYERFELRIASLHLIPDNLYNPYDSSSVNMYAIFTAPSGKKYRRYAFWMMQYNRCDTYANNVMLQPGQSDYCDRGFRDVSENLNSADPNAYLKTVNTAYNWRVRFAPPEIGTWTYKVYARAGINLDSSAIYSFTVTSSSNKGYIGVDTNHRYFRYRDNGEVFIPLGLNVVKNSNYDSIYNRVAKSYVTEMISQMAPYGGNLLRIMMQPYNFAIEWGPNGGGDGPAIYNTRQRQAADLDSVLTLAEANNVYLQLVFDHQDMFTYWWDNHPYNNAAGGYIDSIQDFFTNSNCKAAYKQKMRYIIARWGYSPHIFAFEPIQEIDLYGRFWHSSGGKDNVRSWYREMIQYGKSQNANHLFTCSVMGAGAAIWDANNNLSNSLFGIPELDFVNEHNYIAEYDLPNGIYLYKLSDNKKQHGNGKVVIMK